MSSQAPRADERLPLVSQRREQHQQLGGGELSRLITSMAIGAVVVEVQTEEELAVQAAFAVMSHGDRIYLRDIKKTRLPCFVRGL